MFGVDIIKKIIKTVTVVTALSCLERGLGFLYRVFLSRNMGSEGLGLYQIALSVVGVLMTVSASGIPITVSRLMIKETAKKHGERVNATVSAGILTTVLICLPICVICFLSGDLLNVFFADERCKLLFLIILPGVLLTSIYAVIRGFFWGTKSFYIYSIIELAEEAVMIIFGIIFVSKAASVTEKTIWASLAVLISYIFSFTVSSVAFFIKGGRLKNPLKQLKPLVSSSAPITFMRSATSFTSTLTALILPAALIAGGMNATEAVKNFGVISGMTLPLLFIPSTIIGSISLVLVPELSDNFYRNNTKLIQSNTEKALLYSSLVALFIIPLFIGTGKYLGTLIYSNELSGIYLRVAAPVMLPMAITMISTSLLNSMGMERKTLLYYVFGAVALLVSIIFLPRVIGNYALIAGLFTCYTINAALNLLLLKKICCNKLTFIKKAALFVPLIIFFSVLCYFSFEFTTKIMPDFLALLFSCLVTTLCLAVSTDLLGIIKISELVENFNRNKSKSVKDTLKFRRYADKGKRKQTEQHS